MSTDRQIVRLMTAMIVLIIASVAPSAVQAHDGHARHGHRPLVSATVEASPVVVPTPSSPLPSMAISSKATIALTADLMAAAGSIQSDEPGSGCCPGPCKGTCCGTMSCCGPGILTAGAALPTLAFGRVVRVAFDVSGLPGVGPEALPRPPRTLA